MRFGLLTLISAGISVSQLFLTYNAFYYPARFLDIYGISNKTTVGLLKQYQDLIWIFLFDLTLPLALVSVLATWWLMQKKTEGRMLFWITGIIYLGLGIRSYFIFGGIQDFFYIDGIRGGIMTLISAIVFILGRRKRYLFDVRR